MRRVLSLLFVLIMVFSVFSVPISALVAEEVKMFEYYYKNEGTFEILESVLKEYNNKFDYETEKEIKMGYGHTELTAAEFDEEKIIIYYKDIEKSPLQEGVKVEYVQTFLEYFIDMIGIDYVRPFVSEISEVSSYLHSIMLPILFDNNTGYMPSSYKIFHIIVGILNLTLVYISLSYLIYILIFLIYCKIKKIKIKNVKRKVILSLLSAFYLSVGGLGNIISFILSLTT